MMKKRFLDGLLTESIWFTKQETSVFPSEGVVGVGVTSVTTVLPGSLPGGRGRLKTPGY